MAKKHSLPSEQVTAEIAKQFNFHFWSLIIIWPFKRQPHKMLFERVLLFVGFALNGLIQINSGQLEWNNKKVFQFIISTILKQVQKVQNDLT